MIPAAFANELFATPADAAALDWGRAPLRFVPSERFAGALSANVLDEWLDCSLLQHPFFEMGLDDDSIPASQITSPRTVAGRTVPGYIDGAKVRRMLDRGATLMVSNLQQWHAPCRRLCAVLVSALRARVGSSAFYTPAERSGLVPHRDDAHVFVVQLGGMKRWLLYDVPGGLDTWSLGRTNPAGPPEMTTELTPGDALYVPMGQAHQAVSLDEPSLHLSITIREPRARDAIAVAVEQALASVPQHAELSGGRTQRVERAAQLVRETADRLADADPDALVTLLEQRLLNQRR